MFFNLVFEAECFATIFTEPHATIHLLILG